MKKENTAYAEGRRVAQGKALPNDSVGRVMKLKM